LRSTSAGTESLQGSERLNECFLFRVIPISYRFEAFADRGFRSADSFRQPIPIRLQQGICEEKVPISVVRNGGAHVGSIAGEADANLETILQNTGMASKGAGEGISNLI
jgi:hypothetical protein